jgi:endo-1,4-beta-D-glucanase Y
MPTRRSLIAAALLPIGAAKAAVPAADATLDPREWRSFADRFLLADGRVIDTGNGGVSHTEGQGWGMLFAESYGDRAAFERIHAWTDRVLARPRDALHAWRYVPGAANPVADSNNATDGDLFIAWALSRAARRWSVPAYATQARAIAHDILRLLLREVDGRALLLPGASGFETPGAFSINPSYYVFPAFSELATILPGRDWTRLRDDGAWLIDAARFGRWSLPPDWLRVSRPALAFSIAPKWPPRCSFDAIRIPLYVAWGEVANVHAMQSFATFFAPDDGIAPAWTDLATNAVAPYPASPGMRAIGLLARASAARTLQEFALPSVATSTDYYSAALTMLVRLCIAGLTARGG